MWKRFATPLLSLGLISCASAPPAPDPQRVLPYDFSLEKSEPHPTPYVATFKRGPKQLTYVASRHLSLVEAPDPLTHPTIRTLSALFAAEAPDIAIVEGWGTGSTLSPPSLVPHLEVCEANGFRGGCGESFYVFSLARKRGVPVVSGEPTEAELRTALEAQGFTGADLVNFYVVRQIPQLKRQKDFSAPTAPRQVAELLQRFSKRVGLSPPPTYEAFLLWFRRHLPGKSMAEVENDDPAPHHGPDATPLQRISHAVGLVRDRAIVGRIADTLKTHDRVLVVFGASHLLTQLPALVESLGTPRFEKLY